MKKEGILIISALTLCLCACDSGTSPTQSGGIEATNSTEESEKNFNTILNDYYLAYTENWTGTEMRDAQVGCLSSDGKDTSLEDLGYAVMDVDGDDVDELIVGLLNGKPDDPICGLYYNFEGFYDTYGESYTDGFEDPSGWYPSFIQYYLTYNEASENYDMLIVTLADSSEELPNEDGNYYVYELETFTEGCTSMELRLGPVGKSEDGSVKWLLQREATPSGSSDQEISETEMTQEEAENMIQDWIDHALVPEYIPLTEWKENPSL